MRFFWIFIIVKLIECIACNGPGTVFFEFVRYKNPAGKTDAGKDCDSWFHQLINDKCDLVFNICITDANVKAGSSECSVGFLSTIGHIFRDTNMVIFQDRIGFIPNPFNFSQRSMPENVMVSIRVLDDDIDGQELISRMEHAVQLPITQEDEYPDANKIMVNSRHSEMTFKIHGKCAVNHYGPGCSRYCKLSYSRQEGFFACDKVSGEKHCLIGWTGENCRQADVCQIGNPCHGNSLCVMNGSVATCQCPPSLTGRYCDVSTRPCDMNPCANGGLCVRSNDSSDSDALKVSCNCPRNFTGVFCEKDINECEVTPYPCHHNGKCVNTVGSYLCLCSNNYWGVRCEKPPVYSVLGLDGSYLYKSGQTASAYNVVIILLAIIVCMILVILVLVLLYLKKHHTSLLGPPLRAASVTSIYSQCHYEDVDCKSKWDRSQPPEEEDQYQNIYEVQSDDPVVRAQEEALSEKVFVPKSLSETTI